MSKCGVISGPYFPVFGLNTGKYGPEITPYLDFFHVLLRVTQLFSIVEEKNSGTEHCVRPEL